jgi:hypothetical protein
MLGTGSNIRAFIVENRTKGKQGDPNYKQILQISILPMTCSEKSLLKSFRYCSSDELFMLIQKVVPTSFTSQQLSITKKPKTFNRKTYMDTTKSKYVFVLI